jgi:cytochrome c556
MNRLTRFGVAATLAAISVAANSQGGPPPGGPPNPDKTAIETRQGLFKLISNQYGPVGAMMRPGGTFNAELAGRNAARVKVLAEMIPELFARDTRQYTEVKTRALEGIWNSQADFKAKADGLVSAADALATAAKSGDQATVQKAATEVGKACGACHDNFRAK